MHESHDGRNVASTRRTTLQALGAAATGIGLTGTASANHTDQNVITIVGWGDETATYQFRCSSEIEKSTANDATINDSDWIDGTQVFGQTTEEADSYVFDSDGEITDFQSDGPVYVDVNGDPLPESESEIENESGSESDEDPPEDEEDEEDEETEGERINEDDYDEVVDITEFGADNSGSEPIENILRDVANDGTLVRFPEGEYLISGRVRLTNYNQFGMVGTDATINVAPTNGYVFKLGTYRNPIDELEVEGFTVDISNNDTGGRVFELQAADSLGAYDITVVGQHDTPSKGPVLVGLANSSGEGVAENIDVSEGGEDVSGGNGGTGILVSNYHEGTVTIRNPQVGPFPDNGIYCSNSEGEVHVEGGVIENTNVAGIRIDGDTGSIDGTEFTYDEDIEGFDGQRPIRLDGGSGVEVSNVSIDMSIEQTEAIRLLDPLESATIRDSTLNLTEAVRDGISITDPSIDLTVENVDISGQRRYEVYEY